MTREEWKARCAARFAEVATWLSKEDCAEQAQMCFESFVDAPFDETAEYHPEDCADEEMSEWTDDEA